MLVCIRGKLCLRSYVGVNPGSYGLVYLLNEGAKRITHTVLCFLVVNKAGRASVSPASEALISHRSVQESEQLPWQPPKQKCTQPR